MIQVCANNAAFTLEIRLSLYRIYCKFPTISFFLCYLFTHIRTIIYSITMNSLNSDTIKKLQLLKSLKTVYLNMIQGFQRSAKLVSFMFFYTIVC